MGQKMRAGVCFAAAFVLAFALETPLEGYLAAAMPVPTRLSTNGDLANLQRIEDTCWWWGARWQYGWRGYAWYPCWDWTKPFPNDVVTPEAVPESAVQQACIKRWRDRNGMWHAQYIC
jgi:hypothetical protein